MGLISTMVAAALSLQGPALPGPSSRDIIAEHRLEIVRNGESYSGRGWDRLLAEAEAAQFFMLGEQHATADIARFAAAFHVELARRGYSHGAIEVGPWSTRLAERLIRSGSGHLADYIRAPGHAFALPFLFFQEEIDLVEQIVATSPDREQALWGLDQEFVGSGPVIAERLTALAVTEDERAAAAHFAELAMADPMLVGKLEPGQLDRLAEAFEGNADAIELIDALRLTSRIYAPFLGRGGSGYLANLERENYMKTNFVRHFAEAERRLGQPPKVFLKFGGSHAMRGPSLTNVPGLGGFLAEWGLARGFSTVNMMVDCAGGQSLNPQTGQPAPCQPYFGPDSLIGSLTPETGLTLIDLRSLRPSLRRMDDLDPLTRQTILAFDYYLSIRNVRPATAVATLPRAP